MEQPWYETADPIWAQKSMVEYDRKKLYRELKKRGLRIKEAAIAASEGNKPFYSFNYRKCHINVKLALRLQVLYGIDPLTYVVGEDHKLFQSNKRQPMDQRIRIAPKKRPPKYEQKIRREQCKKDPNTNKTPAQIRSGNEHQKRCKVCMYRDDGRLGRCAYILITGHMRGCPADACTEFKPGPMQKINPEPLVLNVK